MSRPGTTVVESKQGRSMKIGPEAVLPRARGICRIILLQYNNGLSEVYEKEE